MNNPPEISSARLRLRALRESDTETMARIFADPEMSRYSTANFFSGRADVHAMMTRRLAYEGPAGMGHWAIELSGPHPGDDDPAGGTVIGLAHLRPSSELPGDVPEIGYYVDRAYGGKGLATEAAAALLDYGLATLGLPAVWALIHEANMPSLNLARRLGFLDVGGGTHYGDAHRVHVALPTPHGRPHHIELWVGDLARAEAAFGWLLGALGWREYQRFSAGVSWRLGTTYLVIERSPALTSTKHERTRPGLNHLALHVDTRARVDELAVEAQRRGWRLLFGERHPYAGGPEHYAAYLENTDGFEFELVAIERGP